jgi:hypothetical protein
MKAHLNNMDLKEITWQPFVKPQKRKSRFGAITKHMPISVAIPIVVSQIFSLFRLNNLAGILLDNLFNLHMDANKTDKYIEDLVDRLCDTAKPHIIEVKSRGHNYLKYNHKNTFEEVVARLDIELGKTPEIFQVYADNFKKYQRRVDSNLKNRMPEFIVLGVNYFEDYEDIANPFSHRYRKAEYHIDGPTEILDRR